VVARGIFETLPDAELGRVPMHAPVPRLSATPAGYRRPAPPSESIRGRSYANWGSRPPPSRHGTPRR
jgi:crotonobetainyl-CoA:carnitine CoA-transferase CaiB-like acyl-CoA transferase